jgi:hypothetical protein
MCSFTLSVVGSWEADDPAYARPIAAPLQRCAELLGVDLATITAAAGRVQPYVRVDGTKEGPVGEVVRLSGGTVTLQDAVDAFMDHHDLARSTRRVYRASLASLAAGLGPATAVGELSGLRLAGWFTTATPRRRRPPGTGSWPPCGPSPAVSWSGCLPAGISRCGSEPCGGCCKRPPPAPTSCYPWT